MWMNLEISSLSKFSDKFELNYIFKAPKNP